MPAQQVRVALILALLDYLGKDKFEIDCDPGYEYLIVFAYSFSEKYDLAMNKNLYPSYDPKFRLPQPEVIPY